MDTKSSARAIAHYIVDKCTIDGAPISNLQLHKMMYLIQFAYCKAYHDFLFNEEFEAWQYGPVLPEIYDEFSFYGGTCIQKQFPQEEFIHISDFNKRLIDGAVTVLRQRSPWDLVNITHQPGWPWEIIWDEGRGNHKVIPNSLIMDKATYD